MSLHSILSRAEERQRSVHQARQAHRDCLKTIEVEDQALKRIIATGRKYEEAINAASPELLALIGIASAEAASDAPAPAEGEAPAPADLPPIESPPDPEPSPPAEAPEPQAVTTNAEAEDRILDVLKRNAAPDGVCTMSISGLCKEARLNFSEATNGVNRLLTKKRIQRVSPKGAVWAHRVLDAEAASAPAEQRPLIQTRHTNIAAPARPDALPRISSSGAIRERVLAFLQRAQTDGRVLIETAVLAKKTETTELRLDEALVDLAQEGAIVRRASGLKGHIAIEVLRVVEAAE